MKKIVLLLAAASAAGCVTTAKYNAQEAETKKQTARADASDKELAALYPKVQDLESKLKTSGEQISSLQESNKTLQESLEAKKGELSKKIADLIKERDAAAQKIADLTNQAQELTQKLSALEQAKQTELAQVKKNYEDLTAGLKSEIEKGEITITQLKGKLTVNMVDKILFDSGSAQVKNDGKKVLDQIATVVANVQDKDIRIEGHTDNVPISDELKAKYATNWELSTARATSVARYLQDHARVDPKKLMVVGYGENRPVSANDTPEHRAFNRRIEIVLTAKE